jgi:magnesium transporter
MISIHHRTAKDTVITDLDKPMKGSWICVNKPDSTDLQNLSDMLDLDIDTLNDALDPYEAPRIAVDSKDIYIFTRYCNPANQQSSTEPLLILYTATEVVTVTPFRAEFLAHLPNTLQPITTQKTKLVLELLEQVNATYMRYIQQVTRTTFRIRAQVSKHSISNKDFLTMIDVEEDLNEMLTSLQSHSLVLEYLFTGKYVPLHKNDDKLIEDLKLGTAELIELTKSRLRTMENIREAYTAISANILNATFKRLTSIAIFLTIPTIIGGLYGMNITLPFADSPNAFFGVMGLIAISVSALIIFFHKQKWL